MLNFRKICQLMFMAVCFSILFSYDISLAQEVVDCNPACTANQTCKCLDNGTCRCIANPTPSKDTTAAGSNNIQPKGVIDGCSTDLGLFAGLITTGNTIFSGLRDLIYVVAGFGIIGVAVGGFFGNLNWKWLGAIIIGLVVIATTGELISAITGCENFTSSMIQDTLK